MSAPPTPRRASARRRAAELSQDRRDHRRGARAERRQRPPRLRLPRRERRLRKRRRRCRPHLHRPGAGGHRRHGRQDARARAGQRRRRARRAGGRRPAGGRRRGAAGGRRSRIPAAHQGRRRRRRQGMRIVRAASEFAAAREAAAREALSAFGDGRIFLERYFDRPHHVEVQILADQHGTTVHLGERECSIQRRHQKIIEESPSPVVTAALRDRLTAAAIAAARSVGYAQRRHRGVPRHRRRRLLLPGDEHAPAGRASDHRVGDRDRSRARADCGSRRVSGCGSTRRRCSRAGTPSSAASTREDPAQHFLPSPGRIALLREPQGPGIRVDSGICAGGEVTVHYDPMLAKLSAWAGDRDAARRRLLAALRDYVVIGVTTNIAFLSDVLSQPAFAQGATQTHFLDEHLPNWASAGRASRARRDRRRRSHRVGARRGGAARDRAPERRRPGSRSARGGWAGIADADRLPQRRAPPRGRDPSRRPGSLHRQRGRRRARRRRRVARRVDDPAPDRRELPDRPRRTHRRRRSRLDRRRGVSAHARDARAEPSEQVVHLQPQVLAPMPGKVLQVLVDAGQSVAAGDGLAHRSRR